MDDVLEDNQQRGRANGTLPSGYRMESKAVDELDLAQKHWNQRDS